VLLFTEIFQDDEYLHCCLTGVEDARMSAEEMDVQRQENIAYEYLCHLEEAKVYARFTLVLLVLI